MCLHVGWCVERWKEDGFNTFPVVYLHTLFYRMNIATLCIYACLKLALCSYVVHDMSECVCVCVLCNWFVILSNIELFSLIGYVSSFSHSLIFSFALCVVCINRIQTKPPNCWMDTCESAILISDNEWREKPTKCRTHTRAHIYTRRTQMNKCEKQWTGKKARNIWTKKVFHIHVDSK